MLVKAAQGLKVPKEGKPREYITDDAPVEIDPTSHYYVCRLADRELIEVPAEAAGDPNAEGGSAKATAKSAK